MGTQAKQYRDVYLDACDAYNVLQQKLDLLSSDPNNYTIRHQITVTIEQMESNVFYWLRYYGSYYRGTLLI